MNDAAAVAELPNAEYWTPEQARAFLGGVSESTFARWRVRHHKVRGLVRYQREDLVAFMDAHAVDVVRPNRRAAQPTKAPARPHGGGNGRALADTLADLKAGR